MLVFLPEICRVVSPIGEEMLRLMKCRFTRGFPPKASQATKKLFLSKANLATKQLYKLEKVRNGSGTILVAKELRHSKMVLLTREILLIGCRITRGQCFNKMWHHTIAKSLATNFKAKILWNLQAAQFTTANKKMNCPTDRASRKTKMMMLSRENILIVYRMDQAKKDLQMGKLKLTLEKISRGWTRGKKWM